MAARLETIYREKIRAQLQKELGFKSVMRVPRIEKITVNMGVGGVSDKKGIQAAVDDMTRIVGQQPIVTNAHKSIAGFKIRAGYPLGCKVTLRKQRMYEFLDRLISIAIPRIRDFRGFNPKSFDGRGNYSFGITEQIVFPEIEYDKVETMRGMDITITTSARTNEEGLALLTAFNFPLRVRKQSESEEQAAG